MGHARQENLYSQMHAAMKPTLLAQGPHARRIEQGGRLVAAPPGAHTAILQMPRGNLETVCPRPLVVAAIADALQVCCRMTSTTCSKSTPDVVSCQGSRSHSNVAIVMCLHQQVQSTST